MFGVVATSPIQYKGYWWLSAPTSATANQTNLREYLVVIITRHAGVLCQDGLWHLVSRTANHTRFGALAPGASYRITFPTFILTCIRRRLFSTGRIFVTRPRYAFITFMTIRFATY